MPAPTLRVFVDFDSDTAYETNPLILGSATKGILGTNRLGSGVLPVEITNLVTRVGIRRGRNRITSKFEFGAADVILYDQNGDWNPMNPAGAYYPNLVPLRQIIIYATYLGIDYYLFSGFITDYDTGFRQGNEELSTVTLRCVDATKLLAGSGITTVPSSPAGQLSARVLMPFLTILPFQSAFDQLIQAIPRFKLIPVHKETLGMPFKRSRQANLAAFTSTPKVKLGS